jgi:hypothetical protein
VRVSALKSYYALPVITFALAAGAIPLHRWSTRRRLVIAAAAFGALDLIALPILLPVLPLPTAERTGIITARGDYRSEVGWPDYVRQIEHLAVGVDVIVASNYGEAGALQLFGHHLPPVASADKTMRYWRPAAVGRHALLVGYTPTAAAGFCSDYHLVASVSTPDSSDEHGQPIARCTLTTTLDQAWAQIIAFADYHPY